MDKRLIEVDFPLKQTSLDSVHEKNVRHGHISTLHIWPARRPLAASRAALIATLLPDPGNEEERKEIMDRLAGRIVERVKKKKLADGRVEEQVSVETEGGILHWGRESSADLQWFRDKIRAAYGGRAPRVLAKSTVFHPLREANVRYTSCIQEDIWGSMNKFNLNTIR
jgi:putative DNA methylase